MSKLDTWKALKEPVDKRCSNCIFDDPNALEGSCPKFGSYECDGDYGPTGWEWNGEK